MSNVVLINEFLVESFENLTSINEDLTNLEKNPNDKELLNKIYRTTHTMKGSAGFLGYKKLQDLTHSAENLLEEIRENRIQINSKIIDSLLNAFDLSSLILKAIENNNCEGDVDILSIKKKLDSFFVTNNNEESFNPSESGVSSAALESLKELIGEGKVDESAIAEFEPQDNTKIEANHTTEKECEPEVSDAAMDSLKELITDGVLGENVMDQLEEYDSQQQAPVQPEQQAQKVENVFVDKKEEKVSKSIADSFVRVNVSVLDKIMNTVGELVLNRNQIMQFSNEANNHELTKLSQHLNTITSELQSEVMSTRMQPIGSVLSSFERLVRDFSRSNNKIINLKLSGQETELDKTLIEAIKDPLVHIIRNACDHGIETTNERQLNGKHTDGTIWIKSYNESGQVTIEISDDGIGLNRTKIGKKALEKNLITDDEYSLMKDHQVYALIFHPGFSTAKEVTNISGRGVGLDVVKTNIEKIGGTVSVSSTLGEGTTFKLRIPLTLAIVPALVIKSKNEFFAVPQLNLVELVRLESDKDKTLIEKIHGSEFFKLRGNLTPVFRLNEVLKLDDVSARSVKLNANFQPSKEENAKVENKELKTENIIVLTAEDQCFGIIVDEILDTEEIVVKPLSNNLKHLSHFGGATIMGDGKVALILDALGFLNTVTESKERVKDDFFSNEEVKIDNYNTGDLQENLLFRLGDSRLYAIPLQLVTRLEEFNIRNIEKTGNQPIIRYLNAPMPLINVEKTLRLNGISVLERPVEDDTQTLSCIVTTIRGKNYGIVVDEIRDISIDNADIDATAIDREGILGTIFINDKTVSLIDIYKIIEEQGLGVKNKVISSHKKMKSDKKILLVDDSAMYRKMEADALIEAGYQVDVANNGKHGLEVLELNNYDLLITDIEMPILDGYNFASKVRSESNQKDIKIVALSTKASDEDRQKGMQSGFDYHLEKFKKDEVLDLVTKILNGE